MLFRSSSETNTELTSIETKKEVTTFHPYILPEQKLKALQSESMCDSFIDESEHCINCPMNFETHCKLQYRTLDHFKNSSSKAKSWLRNRKLGLKQTHKKTIASSYSNGQNEEDKIEEKKSKTPCPDIM